MLLLNTGQRPRLRLRGRMARQPFPADVELAYFANVRSLLVRLHDDVRARLYTRMPAIVAEARRIHGHRDSPSDDARRIVAGLRVSADGIFTDEKLFNLAGNIGARTSEANKRSLGRQLKNALGVEIPLNDRNIGERLREFTTENVSLVTSIPREYLGQLEKEIVSSLSSGERWEEMAKSLEERFGVAESRAQLIARDQVGKFFGAVNQARQENLGISRYRWRGVMDNRERDEHVLREGEIFSWDDAPEDGHPGEPINCRCGADPVLEDVLAELEAA